MKMSDENLSEEAMCCRLKGATENMTMKAGKSNVFKLNTYRQPISLQSGTESSFLNIIPAPAIILLLLSYWGQNG